MTFVNLLHPEDVNKAMSAWEKLAVESLPISFEFRWKWPDRELTDDEKELGGQWVRTSLKNLIEHELTCHSGVRIVFAHI